MNKIRLLIATDSFLPRRDGVTRFLEEIIPRLKPTFSITIVGPQFRNDEVALPSDISYVHIPLSKRLLGDFFLPRFKPFKIMKAVRNADIVFSQSIGTIGGTALFFARRFRKKSVSFIHSVDWELASKTLHYRFFRKQAYPLIKWLAKKLYGRCTHLLLPSERIADLLSWTKITTPKTIIHLGVDTTRFTPEIQDREQKRASLGFSPLDIVIGYHGRISREKDLKTLLRAFVKLKKRYAYLKLLIIGSGVKQLETLLERQAGVIRLPVVADVERYLPLMDIYCLPSLTETTSLSTLEAMSSALPVVTTPVGFINDYIVHDKNGLFFVPKDSFSLAKQLERCILDKQLRKRLGDQARHTVVNHFDWDFTALRLLSFFKELAEPMMQKNDKKYSLKTTKETSQKTVTPIKDK